MVLNTRPDWTRATTGIPVECVVRVHGDRLSKRREDVLSSRSRVSLVRPGSLAPRPEDEYDVTYVYGPESTNADLVERSIAPLLRKFAEGYNVTIVTFGATGSGKTTTLEGPRGKDTFKNSSDGDGLIHLSIDALFKALNDKAVAVGNAVAQKRRMPSAKGFDFFLESSYVEIYNEACHDLYQRGAALQASLPVYEDDMEGNQVTNLMMRMAKNPTEMRQNFNFGRSQRDMQMIDLGSVHERTAAVFTIYCAQYAPAAMHGEEDRVMVSKMQFVDMPGSERLAMDPELLRLREGPQLNKGLLAISALLRQLHMEGGAGQSFANYQDSVLTQLLGDALGGNSLTLVLGTLRQGEWELSSTTMKHLALAQACKQYPIINHGRSRGLIQKLRHRVLLLISDRETLRDQLHEIGADGDPNGTPITLARVRDLEARLLAERDENAAVVEEKNAMQARLTKIREAGTGDLQEKSDMQDALIKSEEQRLEVSRMLIDFQMEFNDAQAEWEDAKFALEQHIVELEAGAMEHYVRIEDHLALQEDRNDLNAKLLLAQEELERMAAHVAELEEKCLKMQRILVALGGEPLEGGWDVDEEGYPIGFGADGPHKEMRRRLLDDLKHKERTIREQTAEVVELRREIDRIRNMNALTRVGADEIREAYRRKLETFLRDIADMSRAVAIMEKDGKTGLKVTPEDLFKKFQQLADENMRVTEDREAEMRHDMDELQGRHVEFKRKFKSLYLAYRSLRYLLEDQWPPNAGPPPTVPTEEEVLHAALEDILRSEEEADRRQLAKLREKMAQQDNQLASLQIVQAAHDCGVKMDPISQSQAARKENQDKYQGVPGAMDLENQLLREELDKLQANLQGSGADKLKEENALLAAQVRELANPDKTRGLLAAELSIIKAENEKLRRNQVKGVGAGGGGVDSNLHKQMQEFTRNTQLDLERKLSSSESRAVMAEEQLDGLQKYITQASVTYQREIMRLRAVVGQLDPSGKTLQWNPLNPATNT